MDELKSFERTHWLRVYVAAVIRAEEAKTLRYVSAYAVFQQSSFMDEWSRLTRRQKEIYLAKADARIIEFKNKIESISE